MTRLERAAARQQLQQQTLANDTLVASLDLSRLDEGQRWVLFALVQMLCFVGPVAPLRRVVFWLAAHSGMDLGSDLLASLAGLTDRALRDIQATGPDAMLSALRYQAPGRPPKLRPEHVGPVAKFLVAHPHARSPELLAFLRDSFGITVDRGTLQTFLTTYGLGCLRQDKIEDSPLFWDEPSSAASSS